MILLNDFKREYKELQQEYNNALEKVGVDKETGLIDLENLESLITERTKAIVPVHLYGQSVNMPKLMEIAKKYNLKIVEDCAQAFGAKWNGKYVGTFGDAATFSFYPTKNLGAMGDGGLILFKNEVNANIAKQLRHYGQASNYKSDYIGINSRLDELQAAILRFKLKYISKWNNRRRKIAEYYNQNLKDVSGIKTPKCHEKAKHIYHLYVIQTENRNELQTYLKQQGISSQIHYPFPVHKQPAFQSYSNSNLKNTEYLANNVLSLPIHPFLTDEEVMEICNDIDSSP